MKKIGNISLKLLYIITIGAFVFATINFGYLMLNVEIRAKYFAWYSRVYALISAVGAGFVTIGGISVIKTLATFGDKTDNKILTLEESAITTNRLLEKVIKGQDRIEKRQDKIEKKQDEIAKYERANLETKLTNDFATKTAKAILNKALGKDESDEKEN